MVVLSRESFSNMQVNTLVCPIKNDFCFETYFSRQVKGKIKDKDPQFAYIQNSLAYKNLEIGETFYYSLPEAHSWVNIIFVVVKDFTNQITFDILCNSLVRILLKSCDDNIDSIAIPFLGLGAFDLEIDAHILTDALLEAYEKNPRLAEIKVIIYNQDREQFDMIISQFESLPQKLYRKPKFLKQNSRQERFPYHNKRS